MRISEKLNREIQSLMEIEGYISRAEFIRFVIKFYKYHQGKKMGSLLQENDLKWGEKTKLIRENGGDDDPDTGPYGKYESNAELAE